MLRITKRIVIIITGFLLFGLFLHIKYLIISLKMIRQITGNTFLIIVIGLCMNGVLTKPIIKPSPYIIIKYDNRDMTTNLIVPER